MTGANGEVSFINIKTLNEWDSRVRHAGHHVPGWRLQPVSSPCLTYRAFLSEFPPLSSALRKRSCVRVITFPQCFLSLSILTSLWFLPSASVISISPSELGWQVSCMSGSCPF